MEWDKHLSKFIWAGKKPRVRFKTLKLPKDRGGLALPCLLDYYRAAQPRFLVGWCTPSYRSRWKETEFSVGGRYPMSMLIGDCSLINQISDPSNRWMSCSLGIWKNITKRHQLRNRMGIFIWFAYDSEFISSIQTIPCVEPQRSHNVQLFTKTRPGAEFSGAEKQIWVRESKPF